MKPPLFNYYRATSVEEAARMLADIPGALILAGGQSLVPAMNFRLAAPPALIDIARIPGLDWIEVTADGVTVGAAVRHRDLERHDEAGRVNPLIPQAMAHVAHAPIRNRGTTVGSICHADAAAEMPLVLLLSGGHVTAESVGGRREISADSFFKFHMTTTREADEVIVNAHFPALSPGAQSAFTEFARRKGDYALAAVGAVIRMEGERVAEARLGACGVSSRPVRMTEAEAALAGRRLSAEVIADAAAASAGAVTGPDDSQASQAYRRHLLAGLTRKVIQDCIAKQEVAA